MLYDGPVLEETDVGPGRYLARQVVNLQGTLKTSGTQSETWGVGHYELCAHNQFLIDR